MNHHAGEVEHRAQTGLLPAGEHGGGDREDILGVGDAACRTTGQDPLPGGFHRSADGLQHLRPGVRLQQGRRCRVAQQLLHRGQRPQGLPGGVIHHFSLSRKKSAMEASTSRAGVWGMGSSDTLARVIS